MKHVNFCAFWCPKCNHEWAEFRPHKKVCPACGHELDFSGDDPGTDNIFECSQGRVVPDPQGAAFVLHEEPA